MVCGSGETTVSGGVPCSGSGDEDIVVGVLGCQVVLGTKVIGSPLSCPACVGVSLGACVQFGVW